MGLFTNLKREYDLITGLQRTLKATGGLTAQSPDTIAGDVERSVDRNPNAIAFRFEGQSLTYGAFDALANQFARWALRQGLKKGDAVALFMGNRPEYVACWIGLSKVGVITALVNANLSGQPLTHSIAIAETDHVIVSPDLVQSFAAIAPGLARRPKLWVLGEGGEGAHDLSKALAQENGARLTAAERPAIAATDLALYVYTSGTTGAPKAARMPQWRVLGMMRAFIGGSQPTPADKIYITLPLYHGTGGLCGVGMALVTGATVVLRRKFSAGQFWDEATTEGATIFFYIGELCRYLVNQPPHPMERAHKLRCGVGNGLRPEVWERFVPRFGIKKILEFYGSTEGNVSLLNFDGKIGAIGRVPKYLEEKINIRLVKFDVEAEQVVRGVDGLCQRAGTDEIGEAVGVIRNDDLRARFEGYSGDPAQTEKKILRDVFEKGDMYFRTGDLMRQDAEGYFYFVDRIGDTFRWKGENVSTNEVGEVLASFPGVVEANVYGVQVGGLDGRAGMAAITLKPSTDLSALRTFVHQQLPSYARPLFLRLTPEIETTGTFKYRKVDLVRDGFDPAKVHDPIVFDDPDTRAYVPVDAALFAKLQAGQVKI